MSKRYEPQDIEKKWQKIWQDEKAFAATDDYTKPKYYALVEFPYPSGQGLHVGHPRPYTALDIVARKRRMQGYNVLYPIASQVVVSGMHLVFQRRTMRSKTTFIRRSLPKTTYITSKTSFSLLDIPSTGTERSTRRIRNTITGPSGFS